MGQHGPARQPRVRLSACPGPRPSSLPSLPSLPVWTTLPTRLAYLGLYYLACYLARSVSPSPLPFPSLFRALSHFQSSPFPTSQMPRNAPVRSPVTRYPFPRFNPLSTRSSLPRSILNFRKLERDGHSDWELATTLFGRQPDCRVGFLFS